MTAEKFLRCYNKLHVSAFVVVEIADTPDVRCKDTRNGNQLNVEVCVLEDQPGYARWRLGRGPKPTGQFGTGERGFHEVLEHMRKNLLAKLQKRYGTGTALVVRQLAPIWERDDWMAHLPEIRWSELGYEPDVFDQGLWVLCLKSDGAPGEDDILRLDPGVSAAGS